MWHWTAIQRILGKLLPIFGLEWKMGSGGGGGANHKSISVKTEQISAQLALKEQLMKYT